MTGPGLWLAGRELAARKRRVALAGAVVGAIAAAVTATELVARAREGAVAVQVDAIGPALTVVPPGTRPSALARYELEGGLPRDAEAGVRRALGGRLRAVERRLVLRAEVAGAARPVVGVEEAEAAGSGVEVGSELGARAPAGSRVVVERRELAVARVRPSTGSVEDLAVFVPMGTARELAAERAGAPAEPAPNELRLYLRAGESPRDAQVALRAALPGAAVVRTDRGEVADREVQDALARHRGAAYAVMAGVALLALLIAAHLDALERRVELATLVAIGASRGTVLASLLARSALVAAAGAAAGTAAGVGFALVNDPARTSLAWATCGLAAAIVGAGVAAGVLAAAPTALVAAARDPVRALQDG